MRPPHENVATVLVDPVVLGDLEIELMASDLRLWPVETAPICADGPREAFQIRRRLVMQHRGGWDCASEWTPVWIGFGATWRRDGDPLPWEAHDVLWRTLGEYADHVRFHKRLGGVRPLSVPAEVF